MFSIVKEWKSYRIHIGEFHTVVKGIAGENYKGCSADAVLLSLWFDDEPSGEIIGSISSQWEGLTEGGEAAKWTLYDNRNLAIEDARTSLLTASFDDLIAAERKLLLGMVLTDDDKDALLLKYPQA